MNNGTDVAYHYAIELNPKIADYLDLTKLMWRSSPKFIRPDGNQVLILDGGTLISVHLSSYMSGAIIQISHAFIEDNEDGWHNGLPPGL